MPHSAKSVGGRLSSRLIVTFVSIILAATLAAGALAYWLTRTELEKQTWERLQGGRRVTQALLLADQQRLDNLATLAAQRPTLQQFLRDVNIAGLDEYVNRFQSGADLDVLAVYDAHGQLLTGKGTAVLCELEHQQQTATLCTFQSPVPQLAMMVEQPVLDPAAGRLLGYIAMAIFIDNAYEAQLAAETGLEQSIHTENGRIATSLRQTGPPLEGAAYQRVMSTTAPLTQTLTLADEQYALLIFPLQQANGEMIALAEVALPITDLKNTERQILLTLLVSTLFIAAAGSVAALLLRKHINDEAVQHLRSHFLANITHEFRTPLSALRASVEFLVDEMTNLSREEINELLHAIHMSVTGLQTLVDNLLESISIEAGHFAIRPEPIELDDVMHDAERIMQPLLKRRQQRLAMHFPAAPSLVHGDSTRLTQVVVNLLSNASKYGPMGQTIDLTVELTEKDSVRVSVADHGPGLTPAMRERVFRRFARFNTADGAQHGIGLGLWIVKVIVDEHGGAVGVDKRPGGGAIFWFTLPLASKKEPQHFAA